MVNEALKLSGIEIGEDEKTSLVETANRNLAGYDDIRKLHIPPDVSPPFHFSPLVPGMHREQDAAADPPERGAEREAARRTSRTLRSGRCATSASWFARARSPRSN